MVDGFNYRTNEFVAITYVGNSNNDYDTGTKQDNGFINLSFINY